MIAYRFNITRIRTQANRYHISPEETFLFALFRSGHYTYGGLGRLGFSEDKIGEMLESGYIVEEELNGAEAISLQVRDRIESDPEYRDSILDALDKGRKDHMNSPDYMKHRKRAMEKARKARMKEINERRKALLTEVIIPEFGEDGGLVMRPRKAYALPTSHIFLRTIMLKWPRPSIR